CSALSTVAFAAGTILESSSVFLSSLITTSPDGAGAAACLSGAGAGAGAGVGSGIAAGASVAGAGVVLGAIWSLCMLGAFSVVEGAAGGSWANAEPAITASTATRLILAVIGLLLGLQNNLTSTITPIMPSGFSMARRLWSLRRFVGDVANDFPLAVRA